MTTLTQPNFASGELTPLASGRTDLTKYGTALRQAKNLVIRPHGCAMNRPGSFFLAETKFGVTKKSRLVPFVFSEDSAYMLEFTEGFVRVYDPATIFVLEYVTPYLESDLDTLQFTQSADVLTITCKRVAQREIRRTAITPTFAITQPAYNAGPFLTQNSDQSIQVAVSAVTGVVTITSSAAIFAATHVGALFRVEQEDVSSIKPWEPTKIIKTAAISPVGEIRSNDGKTYQCVAPVPGGGVVNTATGSIPPTHDSGTQMDGDGNKIASFADIVGVSWLYLDSGFGVIRITGFTTSTQVTGTVLRRLPSTVVGSAAAVSGPFSFTGTGVATVFGPLTGNTSVVAADYIVTLDGELVDPTLYTVTQPNGNITFAVAPGNGVAIRVTQLAAGAKRTSLWSFGAWSDNQGYPATCTYFQDRIFYAGTTGQPQGVWGSRNGQYYDFGTSVPSQDDDSLAFFLNARRINAITDLVAVESLLAVTSSAVWRVTDGVDEVLTPSTLGFKPQNSVGGSPAVRSVDLGDSTAYVQTDGRRVRDLLYTLQYDKFTGGELSILAEHLFPVGTTVKRMDYAQYPFSLLHAVRSDGVMPTLSYLREQEVLGWSPWDTQGQFEGACSIPYLGRSQTYVIVKRTIGGVQKRFIEYFAPREFTDITIDALFLDCAINVGSYVGNASAQVTLTGGTTWDHADTVTATSGLTIFSPASVGKQLWMKVVAGATWTRLAITAYTSPTVVSCVPVTTVPVSCRGVVSVLYAIAVDTFTIPHLAGAAVRILADGLDVDPQVLSGAGVGVLSSPGASVLVGLSYNSDAETLDINIPGGESVRAVTKRIPQVSLQLYQTRGIEIGPDADHLDPLPPRENENLEDPPALLNEVFTYPVPTTPDQNGRVFIRQSAPLPMTLIAIIPEIEFGQ